VVSPKPIGLEAVRLACLACYRGVGSAAVVDAEASTDFPLCAFARRGGTAGSSRRAGIARFSPSRIKRELILVAVPIDANQVAENVSGP